MLNIRKENGKENIEYQTKMSYRCITKHDHNIPPAILN